MRSDAGEEDLTARAVIGNAALRLFAEHGHDAVSIRRIAAAAGVSPALVLHHFGSKAGLREAVDRHAAAGLDALLSMDVGDVLATGSAGSMAEVFAAVIPPDSPLPAYLRRLLLTGDAAAVTLFDSWFRVTRNMLDQLMAAGLARESNDADVRAAFMLVADLGLILLRGPLDEALGFDPMSLEGMTRWSAEVAELTRRGIFLPAPGRAADQNGRGEPRSGTQDQPREQGADSDEQHDVRRRADRPGEGR